MPPVKTHSRNL